MDNPLLPAWEKGVGKMRNASVVQKTRVHSCAKSVIIWLQHRFASLKRSVYSTHSALWRYSPPVPLPISMTTMVTGDG